MSVCTGNSLIPEPGIPFITNIHTDDVPPFPGTPEGVFPTQLNRKFCVDVAPKLIWSNSLFVQTLIRSGVSRYLEFKCFHTCNMFLDGIQEVSGSERTA